MSEFFVTGLPRSRTAWASMFLACHHEALGQCSDVDQLPAVLKGRGDCDSLLLLFWPRVVEMFPDAPWAILRRSKEDAIKAARKALPHMKKASGIMVAECFDHLDAQQRKLIEAVDPLVVDWDLTPESGHDLYTHCRPDSEYNDDWFRYMDSFHIERDTDKQGVPDVSTLMKKAA